MKPLILALATSLALGAMASHARAEGDPVADAKPKVVRNKAIAKPKPKTAAHVVTPAAPVPYSTYTGHTPALGPDVLKAPTPTAAATPPVMALPLPSRPIDAPPPPLPDTHPSGPPPQIEISLRCETYVFDEGGRSAKIKSKGVFYVDLFPSSVFPDQNASFRFLFADPAHDSLIRDTVCQDTPCTAGVSGVAYRLVDQRTRHGSALRLSLDRTTGAFYGEEIGKDGRHGTSQKRSEKGFCTPQSMPKPLF